jgi:hypothetical protein
MFLKVIKPLQTDANKADYDWTQVWEAFPAALC